MRVLAHSYLPDAVDLLAGIAFAPGSEAALQTKMPAARGHCRRYSAGGSGNAGS
jgi:hypothetical protein